MPLKRVKVGDLAHLTECSPSVHMILGVAAITQRGRVKRVGTLLKNWQRCQFAQTARWLASGELGTHDN